MSLSLSDNCFFCLLAREIDSDRELWSAGTVEYRKRAQRVRICRESPETQGRRGGGSYDDRPEWSKKTEKDSAAPRLRWLVSFSVFRVTAFCYHSDIFGCRVGSARGGPSPASPDGAGRVGLQVGGFIGCRDECRPEFANKAMASCAGGGSYRAGNRAEWAAESDCVPRSIE